jgi:hypothetical protein
MSSIGPTKAPGLESHQPLTLERLRLGAFALDLTERPLLFSAKFGERVTLDQCLSKEVSWMLGDEVSGRRRCG